MDRELVQSRSLRSIGYDPGALELEIEFHSGRVYRFSAVPATVHAWLMRSPRKGGIFSRMIRDHYAMREVTPPAPGTEDLESALRRSLDSRSE